MKIFYRISDAGYNKVKPPYINNEACLRNFCRVFFDYIYDINIIADNCSETTKTTIKKFIEPINIENVSIGHGAGTFNIALDKAIKLKDDEVVYFVENDYLHLENSPKILLEGLNLGADYVSLYDHPDKYIDGANPYVEGGGEVTKVFLSKSTHWKLTNSTTMTFAARAGTLKRDEHILRKHTLNPYPDDFRMFLELRELGRSLITPLPSRSTHGETSWLAPLVKWEEA